jgi:glutamyl-tRNA reductase
MHFDDAWKEMASVDLVISSTAAPHPMVTVDKVREAIRNRDDTPLCILDIALPRDVEPAVGELENVFLYDIDDLGAVVATNIEKRKGEIPTAELVITHEVDRYWNWLAGLAAVPVLTRFRGEMESIRERELSSALKRLEHLSPGDRQIVEQFSQSLMNKFLHNPSVRLREAAANGRGLSIIDAAQYLFALNENEKAGMGSGEVHSPGVEEGGGDTPGAVAKRNKDDEESS